MYKFANFPKPISIEEYKKQTLNFLNDLEKIFKNKEFSLYNIGELGLPGVSDLDFLIISEELSNKEYILNILEKYYLVDIPIFLEYGKIQNLEYLTHHYNFKYIGGKKIDENLFDKNNKNLFLIYSWKILFFSGLRNFYIPFFKKEIDVKKILSWINDLRYPIFYLSKLIKLDDDIINFINEYEIFRSTWFEHEDKDKLVYFFEKAVKISWDLIFILSNEISIISEKKDYNYGRFPTIFINDNLNNDFFKNNTEKYFKNICKIDRFLILPYNMNYKIWNYEIEKDLDLILSLNKGFLKFKFDSKLLNTILFFKKNIDFIKIKFFELYEKI